MVTKKQQEQQEQLDKEAVVAESEGGAEATAEQNEVATVATEVVSFEGFDIGDLGFSAEELARLSGLDNIDSSEIMIPYASLVQKDTRESKKGDLIFPDGTVIKGFSGETEEDVAILNITRVRVYFPEVYDAKNTFICRSLDGNTGADDGVSQFPGQACASCEFAKYPEGGGASPCRDQRLLLCARKDGSLFHFQISGIGMIAWKRFLSAQLMHLLPKVKKALGGEILGAIRLNLGVKETDTDNGIFAAPDFQVNTQNPLHDVTHIKDILNTYQAYKAFEVENIKTAAAQTKAQMAAGEAEVAGTGPNGQMF